MNTYINPEGKIRISLSTYANMILNEDIFSFQLQSKSGMINRIFANYLEYASASVEHQCMRKKAELETVLCQLSSSAQNKTIQLLLEDYRKQLQSATAELIRKTEFHPSRTEFYIRINNNNCELFEDHFAMEAPFYKEKPGKYISAIIEEYCRKNSFEREEIFFQDVLSNLEVAISKKQMIKLTTKNHLQQDVSYNVYPRFILPDNHCNFHYLIAESSEDNKVYAYRISRIQKIKSYSSYTKHCSKERRNEILALIRKQGVAYIAGEQETIRVAFTKAGFQKLHAIQHLRPFATKLETTFIPNAKGEMVLDFECTTMQAEFYFFKLGKDIRILEPESLREHFQNHYKEAYERYTD